MRESNDPSRVRQDAGGELRAGVAAAYRPARHPVTRLFERFASHVTVWAGSPVAFGSAVAVTVLWLFTGPLFHYSDAWQLVINTGTTIITFLMVFLLQRNQNRDSVALHLKLDELLAVTHAASDRLIGIEDASEEELRALARTYLDMAKRAAEREGEPPDNPPES
ncbi:MULTISPECIES: low affinity iron permease family protein [Burkholderia]|uniref:low affinity iron permease family protein n=1 Tax=Burkholderia TaxID=32008 RepID=UPI00157B1687|nr:MULTISPECIES: low affinity iron permease family protein [Burkholderia]MCU9951915.1 low affinity iron permease family protein [Burkholderia sp. BKH01]MCU9951944.1 low affinity iron permease family protein [Burkholderia sp. BKH01]NTY37189.1 low affinity iron permease family protein [Burkholderia diffusa]